MTTGSTVEDCYQRVGSYVIHTMTYTDTNKQLIQYTSVPVFYMMVLSDSWWRRKTYSKQTLMQSRHDLKYLHLPQGHTTKQSQFDNDVSIFLYSSYSYSKYLSQILTYQDQIIHKIRTFFNGRVLRMN